MQTNRAPFTADTGLLLPEVKDYLRVDHSDEDWSLRDIIAAAIVEIETSASIALITQTVTVTTDACPALDTELPIGPVAQGTVPTVQSLASDGSTVTLSTGFWLEAGTIPVLHLTEAQTDRLIITYTAGLAATIGALPADVRHAIADQACRMYEMRGDDTGHGQHLAPMTARVIGRHRRVRL